MERRELLGYVAGGSVLLSTGALVGSELDLAGSDERAATSTNQTATATPSSTETETETQAATETAAETTSVTATETETQTATETATEEPTDTDTATDTPAETATDTPTPSPTPTASPTPDTRERVYVDVHYPGNSVDDAYLRGTVRNHNSYAIKLKIKATVEANDGSTAGSVTSDVIKLPPYSDETEWEINYDGPESDNVEQEEVSAKAIDISVWESY